MAYKALYRTYRPSTFDEVAGQQHIVKTIKNALETGKLAHAYLFTGPRGTGKTTMAKLLAKALNCEHGIGCQCNECKNCKAIIDGTHPDVLELDAASNNSVDDIRDLIDKVKYGTILGKYKVYIIDEVHMLSTGAFNALLKTLEEPPEHVIFVLATTEPHKILPTILSRCQRYDFTRVEEGDIKERIRTILESENIPFNEPAVDLIISLADGGMRDALSILDQVLRYSGDKLNEQDIMDVFAIESKEEKISLIKSIINKDAKDVLSRLSKYISKGTDIKRLTDDLLILLKDVLIYQTSGTSNYLTILNKDEAISLCGVLNEEVTINMIDALINAQKDFKNVPSINSLFQVTLLKMTTMNGKPKESPNYVKESAPNTVDTHIEEFKKPANPQYFVPEPPVQEVKVAEPAAPVQETKPEPVTISSTRYIKGTLGPDSFKIPGDRMIEIMVTSKKDIKNDLLANWSKIKSYTVHPEYGKAASLLLDGHVLVASNDVLIIEYPLKRTVERINQVEIQASLQTVIKTVFGKEMVVYGVDRSDSVTLQQAYLNRMQIGKLPKLADIKIEIEVLN